MRVLVTGANGFVGSHLVRSLHGKGHKVYGAVRPGADFLFSTEDVSYVTINGPHSIEEWSALAEGMDAVVHLIARTHCDDLDDKEALPLYRKTNVDITKALLEASRRKGVRRFIYLSSIKAVGEGSDEPYTEETPCNPEDSYGISKREAEVLVQNCQDLETVILRPPLIYGTGVKGNFEKLAKAIQKRYPLPFGAISKNRRSLLSVERLSEVILVLLEAVSEKVAGEVFNVADDEAVSTKQLVLKIADTMGIRPWLVPIPVCVLQLVGRFTGAKARIRKVTGCLVIKSDKITKII